MKQTLWHLLKIVVGVGLLTFLYTRLKDPAALWQQIAQADLRLLLLGGACYATAVALSGLKWGVLLAAAGMRVPPGRLMAYQWLAEFFNNFLPAQVGGDVMRGYALASDTRRAAVAAASVLIDRFIGLLVFMLAAATGAWGMALFGRPDGTPFTPEELVSVRLIAVGSGAAALLLVVLMAAILSRRLKLWAERLLAWLPLRGLTVPIWQKLADAFNIYRGQPAALGWTALGSALIVVLTSVNIWLIAAAIRPGSITLLEVLTINPIIVFVALAIPLSPGGLGVRQGAFAGTFLLMGAGSELGFAVGLVQQAIGYIVSLPGGYLWVRSGSRHPAPHPTGAGD
jgi:uncharacterized protein (TIRG00374 family)